jgi:SNF2 family DNA or RNA helicase
LHGENTPITQSISFTSTDPYQSVRVVRKALDRLGINDEIRGDNHTEVAIERARNEQEDFETFSGKARDIRDNNYDINDFRDFERTLVELNRPLKPFQLLAAYHLTFAQNAANFSVPGAGKTATVLAAYNYLRKVPDASKRIGALVAVCPLAAFKAWKDEYVECFGSVPRVLEVFGSSKLGKRKMKDSLLASGDGFDMILISYQSLAAYEIELSHFVRNHDAMLVLDEAHRIKKVDNGLWAEAVLRMSPLAKSRVVLTGTPAPNGYVDLRNLFKFMWPERDIIGYSNAQLRQMSELEANDGRVKDLADRLAPFFIRVNKNHLGLPLATFREPIHVTMGPIQKRIYDAIENSYVPGLTRQRTTDIGLFKSRLIRLRQAASNPILLTRSLKDYYATQDLDETHKAYELTDDLGVSDDILKAIETYATSEVPAKFIALHNLLLNIFKDGGKAVVWCEFVASLLGAGAYLESKEIHVEYLYGGVAKDDRERIIDDFHKHDSSFSVILANPHAVGESISLHKACHNAIYFEVGYNAAAYMQSKDRIHRVGLPEGTMTNYYYLTSDGTIEGAILERVLEKEHRMVELIESQEIPLLVGNIDFMDDDTDDLKLLLKDYYRRHGLV